MIPKIIHQTWKDNEVPEQLQAFVTSWKTQHPEWDYVLWTDEMNRDFIIKEHPEFLSVYDNYPANIQRVDAVRYFILQKLGGVFIDLDFECVKNIEPLLNGATFVAGLEPAEHASIYKKEFIISNAFMASNARNPFISNVCLALKLQGDQRSMLHKYGLNGILESTGPFMLSRIYKEYGHKNQVCILPNELLYPLTKDRLTGQIIKKEDDARKLENAYAIHHHWGSWWRKN